MTGVAWLVLAAGARAGMGGNDGGGDAAGRRPADGAVGARGGHRRRVPVGGPYYGGHQAPRRQGQDLPVPRLRDRKRPAAAARRSTNSRLTDGGGSGIDLDSGNAVGAGVEQGGAAGGGHGEPGGVRRRVEAVGGDAPAQGQPRRAAAREHHHLCSLFPTSLPSHPLKGRAVFL